MPTPGSSGKDAQAQTDQSIAAKGPRAKARTVAKAKAAKVVAAKTASSAPLRSSRKQSAKSATGKTSMSKGERVARAFGVKKEQQPPAQQSGEQLFARMAREMLAEQRARRRWGVFFKLATVAIVVAVLVQIAFVSPSQEMLHGLPFTQQKEDGPFVAVVEVKGVIEDGGEVVANTVIHNLRQAIEHEHTAAVILDINSPGGSSVQAASIYREVLRLRDLYPDMPIYAVIADIGASGGYYIAAAAEQIFADFSSVIGSIGVIYSGFGFTGVMEKLGIDRRVITAGDDKASLDPFSPRSYKEERHLRIMLDNIHRQFIQDVTTARPKLETATASVFSGQVFDGRQALELGLIDALGDINSVAREKIGVEELVVFDNRHEEWLDLLQRFTGNAMRALVKSLAGSQGIQLLPP